jgi:hypothetical protein
MVQRTGLVIALLLAMLAGLLHSQESGFVPPKLVSEAILELPANWKETYSPAEVLIIVEIKADSTATLLKVLDGKNELEAMISDLIPTLVFAPAIRNGEATDANLTLKLSILQTSFYRDEEKSARADSLKQVDKESLLMGVRQRLESESHQNIVPFGAYYRTNYYMMGLNNGSDITLRDGFIQPARMYYNALQYQMLSGFRQLSSYGHNLPGRTAFSDVREDWPQDIVPPEPVKVQSHGQEVTIDKINLSVRQYPWSAACADVYAGLGDYELNFAKVQLLKNHLFGVKDFYTEIGFLMQNGWWQETISDQTSMRLFLTTPVKLIGQNRLSFNFEQYDQDIPSTQMLPGLQSGTLYTAGHKLQNVYLKWALPWFNIGWQKEKEKLSAPGILNRQEIGTESVLLSHELMLGRFDLGMSYQFNYLREQPDVQSLYQYNRNAEHQGLVSSTYNGYRFTNHSQLLVSEQGVEKIDTDFSYLLSMKLAAGFVYNYYNGKDNTLADWELYTDTNITHYPAVYGMRTFAGKLGYAFTDGLCINLTSGSKIFVTNEYDSFADIEIHNETDKLFSELRLSAMKEMGKYTGTLEQSLQWMQYSRGMYELPELTGQTRAKIVRDMGHSNALSAGINLTGHTDYTSADAPKTPVYGSLAADAWFGVKITDLFEFQLMMKNLGDNIIYGVYPHPRTVLATMHWFFLN